MLAQQLQAEEEQQYRQHLQQQEERLKKNNVHLPTPSSASIHNGSTASTNAKKQKDNHVPKDFTDYTAQEQTHLNMDEGTLVEADIHTLFVQFNEELFGGELSAVHVRWSKRATLCAGLCRYQYNSLNPDARMCDIALSEPLLKYRPRSDLLNTLLHEMIHAYLFVRGEEQPRDRDGHGPRFLYHAGRINHKLGTNITVYHTFHDEVKQYKVHVWKCNGPCQKKPPYFGIVSRSMNRKPQPADWWWEDHQKNCGGQYHKIAGPDVINGEQVIKEKKPRAKKNDSSSTTASGNGKKPTHKGAVNKKTKGSLKDFLFKKGDSSSSEKPKAEVKMINGIIQRTKVESDDDMEESKQPPTIVSSKQPSPDSAASTPSTSSSSTNVTAGPQLVADRRQAWLDKFNNNAGKSKKRPATTFNSNSDNDTTTERKRPMLQPAVGDGSKAAMPAPVKPSTTTTSSASPSVPEVASCPICHLHDIAIKELSSHIDTCLLQVQQMQSLHHSDSDDDDIYANM